MRGRKVTQKLSAQQFVALKSKKHRARRCSSLAASKDHLSFCDEPKPNGILVGEPDEDKNFYFWGPENANWARIEVSRNLICCWLKQLIRTSAFDDKAELQQREIIAIKQS
jgi:hypothetical protein